MKPQPSITTERLLLRPCVASDADAVQRLVSDIEVARQTLNIPHPYPEGGAAEWIEKHAERFENSEEIVFGLFTRDGGELVGVMGLIPKSHDRAEIGYWIGVPFWGRGYATEAARAMVRYAFEEMDVNRIEAEHFARNPASGRVLQKAGMRHEGTRRQAILKWNEYLDVELYAILRSEWTVP
jgi:RimJ/RimL family protein N-acetyltransferase